MYCGRINKKQSEEIGTEKSPTKPFYIAKQRVEMLKKEKQEIEAILPQKYEIDEKIKNTKKEIQEEEITLKILQEVENSKQEMKLEDEKIKINENAKEELINSEKELEKELENIKSIKDDKKKFNFLYIIAIISLIIAIASIFIKKYVITVIGGGIALLLMVIVFYIHSKEKRKIEELKENEKRQRREISNKIELIQNEISNKENAIKMSNQAKELKQTIMKEQIKRKYGVNMLDILSEDIGNSELIQEQNYINELKLNLNKYELNKKMITEKTENLTKIEEELSCSIEELEELSKYQEVLEIVKETLNSAYCEMKESITPRFTNNLSNAVSNITNGKYKKVKLNENNNLMLEAENR